MSGTPRASRWSSSPTTLPSERAPKNSSVCGTGRSSPPNPHSQSAKGASMNPSGLPLLLVLSALALLVVSFVAMRRSFLRRLAFRDATRRPGETVLVIAGSLLGTALITGSFIVGDTLDSSIRASATTQLGPVDEVVVTSDPDEAARVESVSY